MSRRRSNNSGNGYSRGGEGRNQESQRGDGERPVFRSRGVMWESDKEGTLCTGKLSIEILADVMEAMTMGQDHVRIVVFVRENPQGQEPDFSITTTKHQPY